MLKIEGLFNLIRLLFFLIIALISYPFIKSRSIYLFLKFSGPAFIKLGQLLSTRSDLVGNKISKELSSFQDKLTPFPCKKAHKIIKKELKGDHSNFFSEFSPKPVASASIAQVYKCKTIDGDVVALKVLRPNIDKIINRDIFTLKILSYLTSIFSVYYSKKIQDIVKMFEFCASHELDLLNEAACATTIKNNLSDFDGIYIPKIYWNLTTSRVLTLEWIDGIPFSNKEAISNSNIDKLKAAENLVIGYFNQVYRDGFFHADMHPGNLFLMQDARIAIVDFGIIGIIDKKLRINIAKILISFLQKDYIKIAKLHIEAGIIPKNTDINEFALQSLIIGESIVGKSVKDISFANLLSKLLKMTRKYNMKTKTELLLLQKTIMLVEGIGVSLNKNLNIWDIAKPWVRDWSKTNIGFDAQVRDYSLDFIKKTQDVLDLIKDDYELRSKNLQKLNKIQKNNASWKFFALTSFSLVVINILSKFNFFN